MRSNHSSSLDVSEFFRIMSISNLAMVMTFNLNFKFEEVLEMKVRALWHALGKQKCASTELFDALCQPKPLLDSPKRFEHIILEV